MTSARIWPDEPQARHHATTHRGIEPRPTTGTAWLTVPLGTTTPAINRLLNGLCGPRARTTDPDTSHHAAALPRHGHQALVANAHQRHPDGLTDFELATLTGLKQTSCGKRRLELVERGLIMDTGIRRPSDTGTPSVVWVWIGAA